jgi:endonuclease YncB( thermonuclease family)
VKTVLLVAGLLILFGLTAWLGNTRQPQHTIIRVTDGDGLLLSNGTVIRIQGIDAPEHDQPYGKEAKAALRPIEGRVAQYKPYGTDRYGRVIARVYVDGIDIGLSLLKLGLAHHYGKYDDTWAYSRAEYEAKEARRGLWADDYVVEPWEWRDHDR